MRGHFVAVVLTGMACVSALPMAVVSIGPAKTARPVAPSIIPGSARPASVWKPNARNLESFALF